MNDEYQQMGSCFEIELELKETKTPVKIVVDYGRDYGYGSTM